MASSKAQIRASEKWLKAHGNERYDRVQLVFPKGFKQKAVESANACGLSLSAYVVKRIQESYQRVDTRNYFIYCEADDLRKGIIMEKIVFNCEFGVEKDVMALAPYQDEEIAEVEKVTGLAFPKDVYAEIAVTDDEIGEDGAVFDGVDQKHFEMLKEEILRKMSEFGFGEKFLLFTSDAE